MSVNASNLLAGVYNLDFEISSNDLTLDGTKLPVLLTVEGDAELDHIGNCLSLDTLIQGQNYTDSILVFNTGCDTLISTSLTTSHSDITIVNNNLWLLPDDSVYLKVKFSPTSVKTYIDTLYIAYSDTTVNICVNGEGLGAPQIVMDTTLLNATVLNCGDSVTITRRILNSGQGNLEYFFGSGVTSDLQSILDTLTTSSSLITSQISNPYYFSNGYYSSRIYDGGFNMYDYGNYIYTDQYIYSLGYTNNSIWANSNALGLGGQYFTFKGTGIWIFAADMAGVNQFKILGGLGANSFGSISSTIITTSIGGTQYSGAVKRVYGAGSVPSVNHLIIAENKGVAMTHTWNSNTNYDDHYINGLANNNRMYYILWAGTSGKFYSDNDVKNIMNTFLNMAIGNKNPGFVKINPDKGTIVPSDSVDVTFTFRSKGLTTGVYQDTIYLGTNEPGKELIRIPYKFTINGTADFQLNNTCEAFDSTLTGGTTSDSIMVYNPGCDSLVVTANSSTTGYFSVSSAVFTIAAFDSLKVQINFSPTVIGNYQDTIVLSSNLSTSKICVSGKAIGSPIAVLDTALITVNISSCNDSVIVPYTIKNTGAGGLNFKFLGSGKSDTLNILAIMHGSGTPHYSNALAAITNNIKVPYKITNFYSTSSVLLTTALLDQDVIWVVPASYSRYWQYSNLSTAIQSFLTQGGGLVASGTGYSGNIFNMGVFTGNYAGQDLGNTTLNVNSSYANHAVADGLPSSFTSSYKIFYLNLTNANKRQLITKQGQTYDGVTEIDYGLGRAIYVGFDHNFTNANTDLVLANAVGSFAHAGFPDWLKAVPDSGAVAINDSMVIDLIFNSKNLINGTYTDTIIVATNDPLKPEIKIPVKFIVNGPIEFITDVTCLAFDTTVVGAVDIDSLWVKNPGCDTLKVTNYTTYSGDFLVVPDTFNIVPNDSVLLAITFAPTTIATVNDTINFISNLSDTKICVSGEGQGAPTATVLPSQFVVNMNSCKSSTLTDTITIINSGQGPLSYNIQTAYSYTDTSYLAYTSTGATTYHTFNGVPASADSLKVSVVLNGDFDSGSEYCSLVIEGTNLGVFVDQNTLNFDTVSITITNATQMSSWLTDGKLDINIVNSSQVNVFSGYLNSHEVIVEMSSGAQWITVNPISGTTQINDTTYLPVTFNATGLASGTYQSNITVETNDPLNPLVLIPVTMNVITAPEIKASANCIHLGSVSSNNTYTDSIFIYNDGCADLNLTNITFSNNDFSTTTNKTQTISIGDSAWVNVIFTPTTSGLVNANMLLSNNDTNVSICLTANVVSLPVATFDHTVSKPCDGEVTFTDNSLNNPTSWYWDFGDGTIASQQNPTHVYTLPGMYTVWLKATNLGGVDSIQKIIDVTQTLYVAFETPDSIFVNTPAQFIDSSVTATGWQWFFGDGASSNLQNPVHTYTNTGVFNVSFVANTASCNKTINKQITVYGNIGINENNRTDIKVYPVPATETVTIEWSQESPIERIEVYDAMGRKVGVFETSETNLDIDISNWAEGLYLTRLFGENGNVSVKQIIVER